MFGSKYKRKEWGRLNARDLLDPRYDRSVGFSNPIVTGPANSDFLLSWEYVGPAKRFRLWRGVAGLGSLVPTDEWFGAEAVPDDLSWRGRLLRRDESTAMPLTAEGPEEGTSSHPLRAARGPSDSRADGPVSAPGDTAKQLTGAISLALEKALKFDEIESSILCQGEGVSGQSLDPAVVHEAFLRLQETQKAVDAISAIGLETGISWRALLVTHPDLNEVELKAGHYLGIATEDSLRDALLESYASFQDFWEISQGGYDPDEEAAEDDDDAEVVGSSAQCAAPSAQVDFASLSALGPAAVARALLDGAEPTPDEEGDAALLP